MEKLIHDHNSDIPQPTAARSIYAIPAAIAAVVIIGIFLHFISDAFLTFVAALFLANIFMPLVAVLRKKKVPMVFTIILILALVAAVLLGVILILSTTITSFVEVYPKYAAKWEHVLFPQITHLFGRISPDLEKEAMNFDPMSILQPGKIVAAFFSLTTLASSSALVLLFMLFILASHGQFSTKIEKAFPRSGSLQLNMILTNVETRVRNYLLTTVVINTFAAVTMTVVLLLFGVDLAILWGTLTFLLMFIPSIGSIFAIILPILLAFLQFDNLGTPIIVGIIVIVSQLLIGSYLSPKIMGSRLNISPLLILVSIIFWGWVWGPLGMILAVPITSTIVIIFENITPLLPLALLMSADPVKRKRRTFPLKRKVNT